MRDDHGKRDIMVEPEFPYSLIGAVKKGDVGTACWIPSSVLQNSDEETMLE